MSKYEILERPEHLPDFSAPPLNEVVMGVQFSAPQAYQKIRAGEVWGLYKADYPQVQEMPPLAPSFETFGLAPQHSMIQQFGFAGGNLHDRFWFLRPDGDELIQFQQDRLLHNWRKVGDGTNGYPRFEAMVEKFKKELQSLETYMNTLAPQTLLLNQCEISYINHIPLNRKDGERVGEWLKFLDFPKIDPDDFGFGFREVIRDSEEKQIGRLFVDASAGIFPDGREMIALSLTVKGHPNQPSIDDALAFLATGREVIVKRFSELTTDRAHEKWGRIK